MDAVDALSKYRFAIARDEIAFGILCSLYAAPRVEEKQLQERLETSSTHLKMRLRDLYQARLVELSSPTSYKITRAATQLLSSLDVDKFIIPYLIDDVVSPSAADAAKCLYQFVSYSDPKTKSTVRESLAAMADHLSLDVRGRLRNDFVLFSFVEPDSISRTIMQNVLDQVAIGERLSEWATRIEPFATSYNRVFRAMNESDNILRELAVSSSLTRRCTEAGKSYTAWRLFWYANSPRSDRVLEACHRSNPNTARKFLDFVWKGRKRNALSYQTAVSAAAIWDMDTNTYAGLSDRLLGRISDAVSAKATGELADVMALLAHQPVRRTSQLLVSSLVGDLERLRDRFGRSPFLEGSSEERVRAHSILGDIDELIDKHGVRPETPSR